MSQEPIFYKLGTRSMHPCFQLQEAHAEAMRTTLCPGCAHPKLDAKEIDVWLQEDRAPRGRPMNYLYGCGIGLIHSEMLDLLPPADVERDLYLGRVYNRHGRECLDWRTLHGRRSVLVRGSKEAAYRTCEVCGRNIYHATGQSYLYPAPPSDALLFGSNLGGLVLRAEMLARFEGKKWPGVTRKKLPIIEPPPDTFGALSYREVNS